MRNELKSRLATLLRPLTSARRRSLYNRRVRDGEAAGELSYTWSDWQPPSDWRLDVRIRDRVTTPQKAVRWCQRQTLRELCVTGFGRGGVSWRVDRDGPLNRDLGFDTPWFAAPGKLPAVPPVHAEAAALLMAAEDIDALVLSSPRAKETQLATVAEAVRGDSRAYTLYRSSAFKYLATKDTVRFRGQPLVKIVEPRGIALLPETAEYYGRLRRGPYLSLTDLGARLEIRVRDAELLPRHSPPPTATSDRPALMVTTSFLAHGGAEHTLFETLRHLRDRFEIFIVTLAPHRPELGDRRADFAAAVTPRIYSLGDWVHPAAMPGILSSLLEATGAEILYNANSTTLFYDFAPGLKATRPDLRIIDHLYDHRVGYIDRYDTELLKSVDACVAENRRIQEVLVEERGWSPERVPMIHPCGRLKSAFPSAEEIPEIRRRLRRQLGLTVEDLVFLTAARMHPQKRPLDLVELAMRVRDLDQVGFVIAGGGDLEEEVDAAIRRSGARIIRLPFRTDIPELIITADVGCLVSDYEGLPVFMMECLQAGRPFLGTDVGEMGAVLRETGAGLVVEEPGDIDALEEHVRQLAEPAVWAELAEKARLTGQIFDVETCAERYAAAFLGTES